MKWLSGALAALVVAYLALNWADGDASASLTDVPLLIGLAALSLAFRGGRPPGEPPGGVVVGTTFAVVAGAMAPGMYSTNTSPAVETVATVLLFGGMVLLPAVFGLRAILPFLAALVVAMALDPAPSMAFPSAEGDASVFNVWQLVIGAVLFASATLVHPLFHRMRTGAWPA